MKKEKYSSSFEKNIKKSFASYGKLTFSVLLMMTFVFVAYEQFVQPLVMATTSQKNIEKRINQIENSISLFMDDLQDAKNNEDFYNLYYNFMNTDKIFGHVIIYDNEGNVKYITQPALEGSIYNRTYNRTFLNRIQNKDVMALTSMKQESMTNSINTLLFAKKTVDTDDNLLSIIFFLDSDVLKDILQHQSLNHLLITDSNDYVIASTSNAFVGPLNRFKTYDLDKESDIRYKVSSKSISNYNLKVHVLLIVKPFWQSYGLLLFFILVFSLIYQRANKNVAERIGKEAASSINKLVAAVNEIKKGNLKTKVDITSNDEFQMLGEEFNQMSRQLDSLVKRNEQLMELRKNAEIKQLEAQFNPHFLYNSLETIRYLILSDKEKAQELILSITTLLRYSIDGDDSLVQFSDDIKYLNLYLEINKIRLASRFDYKVDVDESLLDFMIPKLILQPLIENSIKHGFKNNSKIALQLLGREDLNFVYITVKDNGSGMPEDILRKIRNISKDEKNNLENYGLKSIIQRLNLIYGSKSTFEIESGISGTTISIRIPK